MFSNEVSQPSAQATMWWAWDIYQVPFLTVDAAWFASLRCRIARLALAK
jgi:hypothetical protein